MRISDWSSDVCSSDLRSLSTRRVGTVHQRIVRWCLAVKDLQTDVALPVTQQAAHEIAHAEGAVDIADQLAAALFHIGRGNVPRSEKRRVGKECVSQCRSRRARHN